MKKLWMRAGITMTLKDEEVDAILSGDDCSVGQGAVEAALREGRFAFDGESYIPQCTVERFIQEHDLPYEAKEPEFCLGIEGFRMQIAI